MKTTLTNLLSITGEEEEYEYYVSAMEDAGINVGDDITIKRFLDVLLDEGGDLIQWHSVNVDANDYDTITID